MSVRYAASLLSSYPLSPRFSRWMNRPACHPCFLHLPMCGVGWPIHKLTWTAPHGMFCDLGVSDVIDREPQFLSPSVTEKAPPSFHEYPVSDISVKMKFRWKISVVHFVGELVCTVILVSEWTSGDIELRCRIFQASCTFVATKLRFVFTKVTCRMLPHRSDFIAVSPCEIRFGKPDNPVSIVWRNKRPNTSRSGWPWKKWNSSRKRQKNTKR